MGGWFGRDGFSPTSGRPVPRPGRRRGRRGHRSRQWQSNPIWTSFPTASRRASVCSVNRRRSLRVTPRPERFPFVGEDVEVELHEPEPGGDRLASSGDHPVRRRRFRFRRFPVELAELCLSTLGQPERAAVAHRRGQTGELAARVEIGVDIDRFAKGAAEETDDRDAEEFAVQVPEQQPRSRRSRCSRSRRRCSTPSRRSPPSRVSRAV